MNLSFVHYCLPFTNSHLHWKSNCGITFCIIYLDAAGDKNQSSLKKENAVTVKERVSISIVDP
jgi:hypothetical protein